MGSCLAILAAKLDKFETKNVSRAFFCKSAALTVTVGFGTCFFGPRSAQDGSKTLLKSNFSLSKIVLNVDLFWVPFWVDLGPPNPLQN